MKKVFYLLLCIMLSAQLAQAQKARCYPNVFWTIDGSGNIYEFELTGRTVVPHGIILTGAPGGALAYCYARPYHDDGCPTWVVSAFNVTYYYDSGWVQVVDPDKNHRLGNAGGHGNYLFYLDNYDRGTPLYYYDGVNFKEIYKNPNWMWGAADIAVDSAGLAWGFQKGSSSWMNDSLIAINPAGKVVKRYAVKFHSNNAYGSMWLNDTLYVGLGGMNPVYPNTLLPIAFSGGQATLCTPVTMPGGYQDMDASNGWRTVVTTQTEQVPDETFITLYPNPAQNEVQIANANFQKGDEIMLLDISGRQLLRQDIAANIKALKLNTSALPNGLYIVRVKTGSGLYTEKVVVER